MGRAWLSSTTGVWIEEGREVGKHGFMFLYSSQIPGGEGSVGEEKYRVVLGSLRGMMRRKWLLPSKTGSYCLQSSA